MESACMQQGVSYPVNSVNLWHGVQWLSEAVVTHTNTRLFKREQKTSTDRTHVFTVAADTVFKVDAQ